MRALLVLGGPRLAPDALLAGIGSLKAAGWDVDVASWRELDAALTVLGDELLVLSGPPLHLPAPPARPQAARWKRALRWRWHKLRRAYARGGVPAAHRAARWAGLGIDGMTFARRFHADVDAVRLAQRADVVVAVDRDAVLAVWRIAHRRPDVTALNGLGSLSGVLAP